MGKIVKPFLLATAVVAVGVATGGIGFAAAGSANAFLGASLAGGVSLGAGTVFATTSFGAALLAGASTIAIGGVANALQGSPKIALSQLERLGATVNPSAGRKMVFGQCVAKADVRYAA